MSQLAPTLQHRSEKHEGRANEVAAHVNYLFFAIGLGQLIISMLNTTSSKASGSLTPVPA